MAAKLMKICAEPRVVLLPTPVGLLTVSDASALGGALVATSGWLLPACEKPPVVGLAIRRGYTCLDRIVETGEVGIQLAEVEHIELVKACIDERPIAWVLDCLKGAWTFSAQRIAPPLIGNFPIHLECRVRRTESFSGSHDLVLADVVASWYDRRILDDSGAVDVGRSSYLAFTMGEFRAGGTYVDRRDNSYLYRPAERSRS